MELGFNYPWSLNHYGADIGPIPYGDLSQWKKDAYLVRSGKATQVRLPDLFKQLDRNLNNLQKMGFSVIRFFLLANGYNYAGANSTPPVRRKSKSPNPGVPFFDWSFSPPFVADPRFALNFGELLKRFANAKLQILPSFISFEFAGDCVAQDYARGLGAGGHADCLNDRNKRTILLNTVLNDLLKQAESYRDQIFAWEIVNEPEWDSLPIGPLSQRPVPMSSAGAGPALAGLARWPEVSNEVMGQFIDEALSAVESKRFASSVGLRFYRTISEGSLPTGTIPQFHYYAKPFASFGDPYTIKGAGLFNGKPKPILGEFDSDANRFGQPWPELQGQDTTLNRLKLLEAEGCDYAFLWPDLGAPGYPEEIARVVRDDPIKLLPTTRAAIAQYTGGWLPPEDQ